MAANQVIPVLVLATLFGLTGCDRERSDAAHNATAVRDEAPPLNRGVGKDAPIQATPTPGTVPNGPAHAGEPATKGPEPRGAAVNDSGEGDAADGADDDKDGARAEAKDEPKGAKSSDGGKKTKGGHKKGDQAGGHHKASHGADPDADDPDEPAAVVGALKMKRLELSRRIEGREPVSPTTSFSAGESDKLYAFVELDNSAHKATRVKVTFVPPKGAATTVTLKVGEVARWRTWAKRSGAKALGTWQVIVRDDAGKELGRKSFEVTN